MISSTTPFLSFEPCRKVEASFTSASNSPVHLEDQKLYQRFSSCFELNSDLTRQIVSFQANKTISSYRLYKYKEAFSYALVQYFLEKYLPKHGVILDPFCGSGTTVFAGSSLGNRSIGIELLPIGIAICEARQSIMSLKEKDINSLKSIIDSREWIFEISEGINELRITAGAFPKETKEEISKYIKHLSKYDLVTQKILFFSLLAISEEISYTRKDGQYLRWDYRAERGRAKKTFNKGVIYSFYEALKRKVSQICTDHDVESAQHLSLQEFVQGSCLERLQSLDKDSIDIVITSPPYCNRYDYTRTYALELAFLGCNEEALVDFRQAMLSCTVENKLKDLISIKAAWKDAIYACNECALLQRILEELDEKLRAHELNNNGIPRMIRGYFYDMACVIYELYRTIRSGGHVIMVNDNVKYAGINISVDLILSNIAETLGFCVEKIFVLPQKKGNSSQQMGVHGREPLRKCVYVWRKQ